MDEFRRLQKLAQPHTKLGPIITYHGRTGRPVVHVDEAGKQYIMVRKKGGGT